ncbi:MFS monocarboxylate transporter [Heterobasidion irregulare TC 32-1]|uniref:MFS monocarboxylate transporter n=1 Tax=Heterobasidion irregulare (strain TC 32-1) TaxID=747525 RepID=W4K5R6_HETIT|nr:MFS monocarboxylate transporter [Heterobasidion irregulare TC 32-1]ETW81163.1 MFS monocarboxylate transporter [Heterobasidion irregulare TC 32-1]
MTTLDEAPSAAFEEQIVKANAEPNKARDVEKTGWEESAQEIDSAQVPVDIPDGGWWAWSTLAGAYVNAYGVYQDFFVRSFLSNYSSSSISWIGSIATFFLLAGGAVSGRLFDRGYFYFLLVGGSVLIVLCLFMLSLAEPQHYYQIFLTLGLGLGLGTGATYVPSLTIIAHHFSRRRALAMGIAASGASLGALLHPIMLNNLFHGPVGFANGVRASAGLMAGALILAGLLMRTRLPPRKGAQMGLFMSARTFVKDEVYTIAVVATFLFVQGVFFPLFYIQLYSDEHGINSVFGFYSLTILNFASFVGRIVGGALVNRLGAFNVIVACTFASSVLLFSLLGVSTIAGITVFSLLYGFTSGAYITLVAPMVASLSADVSEMGARIGVMYFFTGLGSLIGTPITGALLTRDFVWWRPIVYTGASADWRSRWIAC